jgi:hypothetical protein
MKGPMVEQAIKIAVTAWPIVFAAIVAQSLKALATYRVERGIRLMVRTIHVCSYHWLIDTLCRLLSS